MSASPPAPAPHGDPGLQPERTSLSWSRTVLALLTASAVMLRWIALYGPAVLTLHAMLIGLAVAVLARQRGRYRRESGGLAAGRLGADVGAVALMSLAMAVLGCGGILLVLADA